MLKRHLLNFQNETLFFFHIPKTAGTSIYNLLSNYYESPQICEVFNIITETHLIEDNEKVLTYRFVSGHMTYDIKERLQKPTYVITFLRDPIQRSISQYSYIQTQTEHPLHSTANELSLYEFIQKTAYRSEICNVVLKYLSNKTYDLELALKNIENIDFIGITEQFEVSWAMLTYQFMLPPQKIVRLNVGKKKEKQSNDIVDQLREYNKEDYIIYERGLSIFNDRYQAFLKQIVQEDYERVGFSLRHPEISTHIDYDFSSENISAEGWYIPQSHPKWGFIRWSGPSTESYFEFRLATGTDYLLEFHVTSALSLEVIESIQIWVGDHQLELDSMNNEQTPYIFKGIIPKVAIKSSNLPTRVMFRISRVQSPNNGDPRLLGIEANRLKITPLQEIRTS